MTRAALTHRERQRPDIALALSLGWTLSTARLRNHYKFVHPDTGVCITMSRTASDIKAIHRSISVVKRVSAANGIYPKDTP